MTPAIRTAYGIVIGQLSDNTWFAKYGETQYTATTVVEAITALCTAVNFTDLVPA